jgi:hypothetical protein
LWRAGFLAWACSISGDDDFTTVEQAVEGTEMAQLESAIVYGPVQGIQYGIPVYQAADFAANNATLVYGPPECVTTEVDGPTVTYTFDDCTGPFGLVHVSGSFAVTYISTLTSIQAEVTGSLSANQASISLDVDADYSIVGGESVLSISSRSSGVGPRGNEIERSGEFTATLNSQTSCISLDGQWSLGVNALNWNSSVSGFEKCAGSCPSNGGVIEYYGAVRDVTITVEFDGSDQASWSSSLGRAGSIFLFCSP